MMIKPSISCPAGSGKLEEMRNSSANVLGLDWSVDMCIARDSLGQSRVVQGNIDPLVLLGNEAVVTAEVERCLRAAGSRGHILNVGHGVVQGTPEENVKLFCDLAKKSASTLGGVPELAAV